MNKFNDNTELSVSGHGMAKLPRPDDALDIKDCGCYTTIRKDTFDMNIMQWVYSKTCCLCTRHFLFISE